MSARKVLLPICPDCEVEHDPRPCAEGGFLCECCEALYASYEARELAVAPMVANGVRGHGWGAYRRGCRCVICRRAHAEGHRAGSVRRRAALASGFADFEHGAVAYGNWGCRCAVCSEAHAAQMRSDAESRRERMLAGSPDVPHGTRSGYVAWYCRCDACCAAGRAAVTT